MNEYSFVGFDITADTCNIQLPINAVSDLRFFIPETVSGAALAGIDIVDIDNVLIRACEYDFTEGFVSLKTTLITDLTCFKFNFKYTGQTSKYSNLFRYVSDITETALVKYLCYEPQFGFDYSITNSYNQIRIPILAKTPQFPQEDKIYIDGNGVRRLLSSKIDKEYVLETEYITEQWHEFIVVALSHDEVYFDAVRLQKSAAYEIDYEEYDELQCGTRIYKASAKMTKNTTIRNTNC